MSCSIAPNPRIALMIDCDNVPAACADGLMRDLIPLGPITVREAYGDFRLAQSESWSSSCAKHDIVEMQTDVHGRGKNAADIAITVRLMDLFHGNEIDGVALVSGDSDFVPLLDRLRAGGIAVFVFARKQTPERMREIATRFVFVENLLAKHPANAPGSNVKPLRRNVDFVPLLERMIVELRDEMGWVSIQRLSDKLLAEDRHFDPRDFGFRQLVDLCASLPRVVVERPSGGEPRVRLSKNGSRNRRKAFKRRDDAIALKQQFEDGEAGRETESSLDSTKPISPHPPPDEPPTD